MSCNIMKSPKENTFTKREQIVEVVNKLFVYTDEQDWSKLQSEVFTSEVLFDMTSLGAEKAEIKSSQEICNMWSQGFQGIDAIHHQAGNYIVTIKNEKAEVKAYAIASHFKKDTNEGNVREFIGSYNLGLVKNEKGWFINQFKYNLKYMDGNVELK